MIRLSRIPIPNSLFHRQKEILGEIRGNTMVDCVYNNIIAGDYDDYEPSIVDVNNLVPDFTKDYQKEDLSKSLAMDKVFNINKPGYGKTLETILWIKINLKKDFKALILCPKSVVGTWEEQLKKYWPTCYSDGTWWIINYEQLYNKDRLDRALAFTWDVIVLDESHKIKSMKSKITQIVFQLKSNCRHCLTGTPIKNRPEDLAAQLKWLDPYSITSYTDFQFAFCNMIRDEWGYKPNGLTKDKTMIDNLQKLLSMYCVGGQEHNDVGTCEHIKVRLKLDPPVKKLYDQVVGEYDKELEMRVIDTEALLEQGIKVSNPIEAATRRQQLASNPQLFNEQLKNVKFEWINDWLEGTDEKVVIFSKYAKTIDKLEEYLLNKHYKVDTVRRIQSADIRHKTIEHWKKNSQVLLGTFGVLGTGVDGLQECCHYVIFVDREWTASDNEQAEKRIWRTGQTKQPIIYILQAIGTIDIKIEHTQLDKGYDARLLLEPVTELDE